ARRAETLDHRARGVAGRYAVARPEQRGDEARGASGMRGADGVDQRIAEDREVALGRPRIGGRGVRHRAREDEGAEAIVAVDRDGRAPARQRGGALADLLLELLELLAALLRREVARQAGAQRGARGAAAHLAALVDRDEERVGADRLDGAGPEVDSQ